MPNRKTKPTSPGRDSATYRRRTQMPASEPEKKLTEGLKKSGGRNVNGRVTARHRGGGAKRRYRKIDFKRLKGGGPAKGATIEYHPNRSCYIALLHYADGHKDYILAPAALKVGDIVKSGTEADIKPGHSMALGEMPTGTIVHNSELIPAQGGKLGRSAGTAIQLVAKDGPMVTLRLPSTEMRMVRAECRGSIGVLYHPQHQNLQICKDGRTRHKGKRPQSRGVALNPVDHPHGGGEAHHTPGGHPVTPWGKPTLGYRTRKKGKQSDRYIVRGRRRGKKKGGR